MTLLQWCIFCRRCWCLVSSLNMLHAILVLSKLLKTSVMYQQYHTCHQKLILCSCCCQQEVNIKVAHNKILPLMVQKDAHLRQSSEALCMNLQGCSSTGISYTWLLCRRVYLEDISHDVKLLESKFESTKDQDKGNAQPLVQNRDI